MGSSAQGKTGLNLTFLEGLIPAFLLPFLPFCSLIPAQECRI